MTKWWTNCIGYFDYNKLEDWYSGKSDWYGGYINLWDSDSVCLHEKCSSCNGTGIRKDGLGPCVHMISCPCPKCSPRM